MPAPTAIAFPSVAQYPANAVNPGGFYGVHKLFFVGTTGLIGSGYGIPGVSATRISTGIYRVKHPPSRGLDIIPGLAVPSGAPHYTATQNTEQTNSISGTTEFHIRAPGGGASGLIQASGMGAVLQNPVSGTVLRLGFFIAPQAIPPGQF